MSFALKGPVTTRALTWDYSLLKFYPSSLLEILIPTTGDKISMEQVHNKVHMING